MIFRTISPLCFFHSNKKQQHTWVTGGRGTVITPRPPLICDPRLLPSASLTALPLSVHHLLHYLSISGEDAPQRNPLTQSVCAGAFAHSFPLLLKPPIGFFKIPCRVKWSGSFSPECWRVSSSGIEEEAKLWLVLCGEVEQPLAQYGVVLFQVLDQIGLFLHHLLQIRASSVTKIRVCKRSSYKNTSLEGYLKYFSNYAAIKKNVYKIFKKSVRVQKCRHHLWAEAHLKWTEGKWKAVL